MFKFGGFYAGPAYYYELPFYPTNPYTGQCLLPTNELVSVPQQPVFLSPPIEHTEDRVLPAEEAEQSNSEVQAKCSFQKVLKHSTQKKKTGDTEYKFKVQDTKRNTFSNVVRHMFIYIRNRKITLDRVNSIIQNHEMTLAPEQFYSFVDEIRLNSYIRNKTVKELWSGKGTDSRNNRLRKEQSKILRILSEYYLSHHGHLAIQLSKKIRRDFKPDHHLKIHEIRKYLAGL